MAEGFLKQPKSMKRMEEIGDQYFHELLTRSLFQKSSRKNSCFEMHDLVNDMAQLVSDNFCIQYWEDQMNGIYKKNHHFSYHTSEYDSCCVKFVQPMSSCVRLFYI